MFNHWSDVMGNELTATQVFDTWRAQRVNGEKLDEWLERQSKELHGADHRQEDWSQMAKQILSEMFQEIA